MRERTRPLGPRIKVKVDKPAETRSAYGIITDLGDKSEDNETGMIVELGEYAYGNFKENWAEVGDLVLFQRYAGKPREELESDGSIGYYRILKDIDVIAKLEKVETNE